MDLSTLWESCAQAAVCKAPWAFWKHSYLTQTCCWKWDTWRSPVTPEPQQTRSTWSRLLEPKLEYAEAVTQLPKQHFTEQTSLQDGGCRGAKAAEEPSQCPTAPLEAAALHRTCGALKQKLLMLPPVYRQEGFQGELWNYSPKKGRGRKKRHKVRSCLRRRDQLTHKAQGAPARGHREAGPRAALTVWSEGIE